LGRNRSSRAAGFTLLELVIVIAMLGVVMGSVVTVIRGSTRACQVGSSSAHLEALLTRVLDRIEDRLRSSSRAAITPALAAPFSSQRIDFQRSIGYAGGVVTWSPTERIGFQYRPGEIDNGKDDDGDGLIDDGRIVWTQNFGLPNESSTDLADGVSEYLQGEVQNNLDDNGNGLVDECGLCFAVDATSVVVRLTLQDRSDNGVLLTKTAEKRVFFRNR
jgi:prepilin-type N-terminal cleavage/methylation domain-containing protein